MSDDEHTNELLAQWINALTIMHIAHHKSSSFFNSWHLFLGIPVVIVSALLGGSIAEVFFEDSERNTKIVTAILGVLAAVLAGIQTFINPASRSKQHHTSAAAFGAIRREVEQLKTVQNNSIDLNKCLEEVREKWNLALQEAPNLLSFIHDSVRKNINKLA